MDRVQALSLLRSAKERERLSGARFLSASAEPGDASSIAEALANEKVRYVRIALNSALRRANGNDSRSHAQSGTEHLDRLSSDGYRLAIEETTTRIVHELAPIVGKLDYHASREVDNYEASATRNELRKLEDLLSAIRRLAQATEPARVEEFDLSELARSCGEEGVGGVAVRVAGPASCQVSGDARLVSMALRNGLRNAVDATLSSPSPTTKTVVVAWGLGDQEAWISVLDEGIGLPADVPDLFGPGTTTKNGHLGVGLTIARMVAEQHGGYVRLDARETGAKFQLRWPQEG